MRSVCNLEPSQPGIRPFEPPAVGWKIEIDLQRGEEDESVLGSTMSCLRIHPCHRFVLIFILNANQEERVYNYRCILCDGILQKQCLFYVMIHLEGGLTYIQS